MQATEWTQLKVTVALSKLDDLVAVMSMVNNNLMIEDYSDIDLKTCYGDLIDESILNADKTIASVSVFLPLSLFSSSSTDGGAINTITASGIFSFTLLAPLTSISKITSIPLESFSITGAKGVP